MTASPNILYVEDDPDIQAIATLALENIGGFTVTPAEGGQQAIELMKKHDFDLLLLDVMMPGMNGLTTLENIRTLPNGKDIPVIFITAKVQKSEMDNYWSKGALGIICKPFDAMTLSETVKNMWESRPQ